MCIYSLSSSYADPCAELHSWRKGNPDSPANPNADTYSNPNAETHRNPNADIYPNPNSYVLANSHTHPYANVGSTPSAFAHRNSTGRRSRDINEPCPDRIHGP